MNTCCRGSSYSQEMQRPSLQARVVRRYWIAVYTMHTSVVVCRANDLRFYMDTGQDHLNTEIRQSFDRIVYINHGPIMTGRQKRCDHWSGMLEFPLGAVQFSGRDYWLGPRIQPIEASASSCGTSLPPDGKTRTFLEPPFLIQAWSL